AFASPTIVGEIRHHFRDRGWDLRVPRGVQELHLSISRVVERLTAEAGATPTVDDIARAVGASTEQVVEAIEAAGSYRSRSLDDNDAARDPVSRRSIATAISIDDPWLASSDDRLLTERLLVGLPARERLIVHMYFWDQDTQEAIAERLGVSQVHVSRLLRRALAHLRSEIDVAD
ncbi:MAG: sigma-70 family RNA polymerase sigma factor, partial [Actinobacteria bacterium]|nr:sigma-70 family RNA polymerase sigma factor [Actinomycetota bacterium]